MEVETLTDEQRLTLRLGVLATTGVIEFWKAHGVRPSEEQRRSFSRALRPAVERLVADHGADPTISDEELVERAVAAGIATAHRIMNPAPATALN